MTTRHFNVLFLCTGNSARSIMAEAILNHKGGSNFSVYSAGSHPAGRVHSEALKQLHTAGILTDGLHSKSWDEFAAPGAPPIHFSSRFLTERPAPRGVGARSCAKRN